MLANSDLGKWDYREHTKAKHAILIRYMKAWLPILGRDSRRLVIVDAFAGRGRYTTDDRGSPLLLRDIAGRVISDQCVGEVELFYIENDAVNFADLAKELESAEPLTGIIEQGPRRDEFEKAAPSIVDAIRDSRRPSFWFIDPFGYAGLPLSSINSVLQPPRSEVLITLMVRDINRFLNELNHRRADAELFGLRGDVLLAEIERVKATPNRVHALRDLYVERLEASVDSGRTRHVTSVGVSERGAADIVYFLIHATGHPKGKREMKEAIWEATGGLNAVVGARLVAESAGQVDMFSGAETRATIVDHPALKALLRERFAGRRIVYESLQNEAIVGHVFDAFIDSHIKKALDELADAGIIKRYRNRLPSARRLARGDEVEFPPT